MRSTVTALDFGTGKVVALVAEVSGRRRCDINGVGLAPYDGFSDARWNNPELVNDAISDALSAAESQAGTKSRDIYVGVPGQFTKIYPIEVKIELQGADPKVTLDDIDTLFKMADADTRDIRGVPIHRSPAWFMVDNGKKVLEPLNQHGHVLRALVGYVIADQFFIEDVTERLAALNRQAAGFFSTAIGEALFFIPTEERDKTALLIDIGYLNTDVMAVEGDTVIFHRVLPIGGAHIAADLTYGLEIPFDQAEQIKRSFNFEAADVQTNFDVTMPNGKTQSFPREKVERIVLPRVEEIIENIAECITESGVRLGNWSPIYLTGGGLALNKGGRELLADKLERPVRELPRKAVRMASPVYAAPLGLLDLVIETKNNAQKPQRGLKAFFSGLLGGSY